MKFEIEILQTIEYETDNLQDILDKFYSECSGHLSVTIKDKDDKELILHLEVNDMEANIKIEDSDGNETERDSYDEDEIQESIEYYGLNFNYIRLV